MEERKPDKKSRLTEEEQRHKERLMRSEPKPGRPVSEEFWKLPKPEDPEGLALRYLLEDRRQGR